MVTYPLLEGRIYYSTFFDDLNKKIYYNKTASIVRRYYKMDIFIHTDPSFLNIVQWERNYPYILAGFTTRQGGYSNPPLDTFNIALHINNDQKNALENRKLLSKKLGVPLSRWVSGEQIHETNIKVVTHLDVGKGSTDYNSSIKNVDGLITKENNILCTAFFADCVPIYYFDPVTKYIGIAHAGWKGTVANIAQKMVEKFKTLGVHPKDLLVVIGPCISQTNYEVDKNVIQEIEEEFIEKTVIKMDKNRFLLDLKQLNVEILLQSGVLRHNIDITSYCTYEHQELFFSHRRDRGKTGRMLGYIGLR